MIALNPEYKKEYYEKYFDENNEKCEIVKKSIQLLEKVSAVIPHTYFIETQNDEFI